LSRTGIHKAAASGGVKGDDLYLDAAAALAFARTLTARSGDPLTATPLDAPPALWPDFCGDWRLGTFREILFHVMAESACPAGDLDAVRELIDGRQWLVLD